MIPNQKLNLKPDRLPKFETYSFCVQKTGFLGYVKKHPTKKSSLIQATPIYVSINMYHLSLYKSTKPSSLFKAVKLGKIQFLAQKYKDTFCFDIVIKRQKTITLCAKDQKHLKSWVHALEEFKKCKLRNKEYMLTDFTKLNKIIKKNKNDSMTKNLKVSKLFYNTKSMKHESEYQSQLLKSGFTLKSILEIVKLGNLAKKNLEMRYKSKLQEAKRFTEEVSRKKHMVKTLVMKKGKEEFAKLKEEDAEFTLLNMVLQKIKQLKLNELHEYKKRFEMQIISERNRAKMKAKKLMKLVMEQQKLTDYSVCYDQRLKDFYSNSFSRSLCLRYYGESGVNMCHKIENFCEYCCDFHIGIKFMDKKLNCTKRCSQVIKSGNQNNAANSRKGHNINDLLKEKISQSSEIKNYLRKKLFSNYLDHNQPNKNPKN
jgi:hypothetical protein